MTRTPRCSTTATVILCLIGTPLTGTLFASSEEVAPTSASETSLPLSARLTNTLATAQQAASSADAFSNSAAVEHLQLTLPDEDLSQPKPFLPSGALAFSTQIYQEPPVRYRSERNRDALTAIMIGAVAAIAGTSVLIYANRPECGGNPTAGGCGYGTKVVGGAVLSGGVVGLMVGALMWR